MGREHGCRRGCDTAPRGGKRGASTADRRGLMSGILREPEGTTYCQVEDARRGRRLNVLFLLRDLGVGVELQAR